jgi:hypothetical protein
MTLTHRKGTRSVLPVCAPANFSAALSSCLSVRAVNRVFWVNGPRRLSECSRVVVSESFRPCPAAGVMRPPGQSASAGCCCVRALSHSSLDKRAMLVQGNGQNNIGPARCQKIQLWGTRWQSFPTVVPSFALWYSQCPHCALFSCASFRNPPTPRFTVPVTVPALL